MRYGPEAGLQIYPVLLAIGLGFFAGAVWDLLRCVRRFIRCRVYSIFLQDFLFFVFWAFLTFALLYAVNDGQVRWHLLAVQLPGFAVWYCPPGRLTARIAETAARHLRRRLAEAKRRIAAVFAKNKPKSAEKTKNNKEKKSKLIKKCLQRNKLPCIIKKNIK